MRRRHRHHLSPGSLQTPQQPFRTNPRFYPPTNLSLTMSPTKLDVARRKGRSVARAKARKQKKKSASSSFEAELQSARELEQRGAIEQAIQKYQAIISQKADDALLHEELASLYMQTGNPDEAEKRLRTAIQLRPEAGFEKFVYLAQILGNTEEALLVARRGIEVLKVELISINQNADAERAMELREYQASAHCTVAEICLGIIEDSNDPDLASKMDVEVEKEVMQALSMSERGSNSEIEAMLSLANLRLSQGRQQDATTSMSHIIDRIKVPLQLLEGDVNDDVLVSAMERLPPMEMRIAVGKQLMEVSKWPYAMSVLGSVMYECDFNVEVWYLLAVCHWKLGDTSQAQNALENTRAVLKSPEGYDGELEEEMIEKLYRELQVSNSSDTQQQQQMQD